MSGLRSLYGELILDHAREPHGAGLRDPFDVEVHHVNPTCGDEVRLRLLLDGDGAAALVRDVSYDAQGCAISVAGSSVMTDEVVGGTVAQALARYDGVLEVLQGRAEPDPQVHGDVAAFAGVRRFPARVRCALLGWAALRDALARTAGKGPARPDAGAGESRPTLEDR
ncbi:Fe-S cluster assembly sulfur transfer protein SufU [Quadrisphaera sp. DSM 44207]|uniref:Fe-S cluster assembly sulfur transfer protein SufU n=1 Tax=Quadrisphaera sp. DSM 44207 TaxID=1881057 RepID=UPI00088F0811|nr:SUF system NifU family Fe-S cluster assembly protein [Quadrisphaera sp. DSM 44207]SDQ43835.1 nitrogen fixation protein NifU [Quadrisphaera sp. DSM 44207]